MDRNGRKKLEICPTFLLLLPPLDHYHHQMKKILNVDMLAMVEEIPGE